jgi:hypothetical protein
MWSLVSEIFAPNLWLPVVHFLRSFVFCPSAHKNVTSSQQQKFSTMTRSSSAAAAAAAADAAFLQPRVQRITKESTCLLLGITKDSIKCRGCTNVEERCLSSKGISPPSIDSRHYKCRQPWVAKGKTGQLKHVYANTWKDLVEELDYPDHRLHDHSSNTIQQGNFAPHPKKKQKLTMPPATMWMHTTLVAALQRVRGHQPWHRRCLGPSNERNHHHLCTRYRHSFNIVTTE